MSMKSSSNPSDTNTNVAQIAFASPASRSVLESSNTFVSPGASVKSVFA